jgi:uncharacterized protein YndB with AHSA1/START domain
MQRSFVMALEGVGAAPNKPSQDMYTAEFSAQTLHSLDEIWGALVKPEKLALWLRPVSGKLSKGGQVTLGDMGQAQVHTCEPKRRLVVTLKRAFGEQTVDVALSEQGKGKTKTRQLRVKVTARISDLPEGSWQTHGPAAVAMGWELVCGALLDYLDAPKEARPDGATAALANSVQGKVMAEMGHAEWLALARAKGHQVMDTVMPAPNLLSYYTGLHA